MGEIINVKEIVEGKKEKIKDKVQKLNKKGIYPKLAVILANNEEASKIYVGKKQKMCKELGIEEVEYILDEKTTTKKVLEIIERLNEDPTVDGILVQLPLFKHLDEHQILEAISYKKDVDGFHPLNMGRLLTNTSEDTLVACTPKGIMWIIDSLGKDIEGMNAVVVGRSVIVGKPISQLLLSRGATVTTCHSKTKDLKSHTKNADILVVATGVPGLITKDMVKKGAIVIDVGINRIENKIVGDVDTKNVAKKADYITPVPGGVGITTVAALMDNLVTIASKRKNGK
jgi:bifunctional protein folD